MDESEFGTAVIIRDPATGDDWWESECGWSTNYRGFLIEHIDQTYWRVDYLNESCTTYGVATRMIDQLLED